MPVERDLLSWFGRKVSQVGHTMHRASPNHRQPKPELDDLHQRLLTELEEREGTVLTLSTDYPDGHLIPVHRHSRSQLLYAFSGVVMVSTDKGRWMVPPEHAIWLPAGTDHAAEMLGDVQLRSIYVLPSAVDGLPTNLRVLAITDLVRSLVAEAVRLPAPPQRTARGALILDLLLHEISSLPEQPLALPFPADRRLAELCRRFISHPSAHATIQEWAKAAGMSRRSFTRAFQRETGLSLSTWRQQACLFAALPRLADGQAVTTVALELGYDSVAAFTTMFRRMTGKPPRAWVN